MARLCTKIGPFRYTVDWEFLQLQEYGMAPRNGDWQNAVIGTVSGQL